MPCTVCLFLAKSNIFNFLATSTPISDIEWCLPFIHLQTSSDIFLLLCSVLNKLFINFCLLPGGL